MALIANLATGDTITETWVDSVTTGLNTGVFSGTYTPTLSGMAVGTGGSATNSAVYSFVAGQLTVAGAIIFGTTGTTFPGANINISLPSTFVSSDYAASWFGMCNMAVGGITFLGVCSQNTSTTVRFVVLNAAAAGSLTHLATSTTVPGTWAAGDTIKYRFSCFGSF